MAATARATATATATTTTTKTTKTNNNNNNKQTQQQQQWPFAGGPYKVPLPPVTYVDSLTPGFLFYRWGVLPGVSSRYVGLLGLPFPLWFVRSRPICWWEWFDFSRRSLPLECHRISRSRSRSSSSSRKQEEKVATIICSLGFTKVAGAAAAGGNRRKR